MQTSRTHRSLHGKTSGMKVQSEAKQWGGKECEHTNGCLLRETDISVFQLRRVAKVIWEICLAGTCLSFAILPSASLQPHGLMILSISFTNTELKRNVS